MGDDGYDTCPYCGWAGKLRKDGTVRKHRERSDSGRIGSTGSLPQDPHGPICKGSGMEPWKVGLPESYEVPPMNEHGGWQKSATLPDAPDESSPVAICSCPRRESEVYAAHHRTVCQVNWRAAQFGDFAVGDRIRFQTIDNGFGGSGDFVSRTGTVTAATARTLRVQCDSNWFGDHAVLRLADWHARDPQKAV